MLVRWDGTLPPVDAARRERAAALVERVESLPGLALTGAWVAGTGIAAVVEHARSRAGRLAGAESAEGAGNAKNAGTGQLITSVLSDNFDTIRKIYILFFFNQDGQ